MLSTINSSSRLKFQTNEFYYSRLFLLASCHLHNTYITRGFNLYEHTFNLHIYKYVFEPFVHNNQTNLYRYSLDLGRLCCSPYYGIILRGITRKRKEKVQREEERGNAGVHKIRSIINGEES